MKEWEIISIEFTKEEIETILNICGFIEGNSSAKIVRAEKINELKRKLEPLLKKPQ